MAKSLLQNKIVKQTLSDLERIVCCPMDFLSTRSMPAGTNGAERKTRLKSFGHRLKQMADANLVEIFSANVFQLDFDASKPFAILSSRRRLPNLSADESQGDSADEKLDENSHDFKVVNQWSITAESMEDADRLGTESSAQQAKRDLPPVRVKPLLCFDDNQIVGGIDSRLEIDRYREELKREQWRRTKTRKWRWYHKHIKTIEFVSSRAYVASIPGLKKGIDLCKRGGEPHDPFNIWVLGWAQLAKVYEHFHEADGASPASWNPVPKFWDHGTRKVCRPSVNRTSTGTTEIVSWVGSVGSYSWEKEILFDKSIDPTVNEVYRHLFF